jgi:hypothetical protein
MNLEQTFRQLARHIDDIWPQHTAEEKGEHKETVRRLRMCNPELRELLYEYTTKAARDKERGTYGEKAQETI